MPKPAKATKRARDEGMITGIRSPLTGDDIIMVGGVNYTPAELAAVYQRHLDKLDHIAKCEARWRDALQEESGLEKQIKPLTEFLKTIVRARFGDHAKVLAAFRMSPRRVPTISAEKKLVAVAKRRATRKLRRTMGKRQRLKIKGG